MTAVALILVYWIVVAVIGATAAGLSTWKSYAFNRYLLSAEGLPLPRPRMLGANRGEIVRDLFLAGSLTANLTVGVLGAIETEWSSARPIASALALVALLVTATLLAFYAVLNYWTRRR